MRAGRQVEETRDRMLEDYTYTFIGVGAGGDPLFMDIAALEGDEAALRHGRRLFEIHDSGLVVEVWRGIALVAKLPRQDAVVRTG